MAMTSDYIVDDIEYYLAWVEIVVKVTRKNYSTTHKPSVSYWTPKNSYNLRGTIKTGENYGFDITIGATGYIVDPEIEEDIFCRLGVYSEIASSYERG